MARPWDHGLLSDDELRYSRFGSVGPPRGGLRCVHVADSAEKLDGARVGSARWQLRRDEATGRLAAVSFVCRVLARGAVLMVPGVSGMNAREVVVDVAVALGHPNRRKACGLRRSCRHGDKRERKHEMSQDAKQTHGRESNDASSSRQPVSGRTSPWRQAQDLVLRDLPSRYRLSPAPAQGRAAIPLVIGS